MAQKTIARIFRLYASDKAFYIILPLAFLFLTVGHIVSLSYHLARADKALYTGSDGSLYIFLAEALSSGRGYREIHLVGEPSSNVQPGLPLLLVPIVRFFGRNILLMKLLITVIGLLSACCVYILLKGLADKKLALVVTFLYGTNVQVMLFSNEILTEIPYLLFSLLALIFMRRYFEAREFSLRDACLSVLFIWLSYFTRALGVSLVAAFVAYFIIERLLRRTDRSFKQALLTLIVIAIPIVLWAYRLNMAQSFVKTASGGYGATVDAASAAMNVLRRIGAQVSIHVASRFFYVPLAPIALYGIGWCLLRRRTVIEYYSIIFIVMLSLVAGPAEKYTFDEMEHVRRYLVPMTPFIMYYFIMGAKSILEALTGLDKKKLLVILAFLLLINFLVMLFYMVTRREIGRFLVDYLSVIILCALTAVFALAAFSTELSSRFSKYSAEAKRVIAYSLLGLVILNSLITAILYVAEGPPQRTPDWDEYIDIGEWVRENTNAESAVMCRKPRLFYYWTGRKVAGYPFSSDTDAVMNSIHNNHVDYVVVDSFQWTDTTQKYLIPALVANKGKFSAVYSRGKSLLLRVGSADK